MDEMLLQLQEVKDRSLRNEARIDKLEANQEALNELAVSVQELATNQSNMKNDLKEIKCDVKAITSVPQKRWDGVVDKVISVLIAAFIAYLLAGGTV